MATRKKWSRGGASSAMWLVMMAGVVAAPDPVRGLGAPVAAGQAQSGWMEGRHLPPVGSSSPSDGSGSLARAIRQRVEAVRVQQQGHPVVAGVKAGAGTVADAGRMRHLNSSSEEEGAGAARAGASGLPGWAVMLLKSAPPIVAQGVFFAPMEAMRKIRAEKSTGSLTAVPYTAMVASCTVWVAYGALAGDPTIWLPNVSGAILGAVYLATFASYLPQGASLQSHYAAAAVVGVCTAVCFAVLPTAEANAAVGYIGVALVVTMFAGPLATIRTVIRTKSTASLPPLFTAASFLNCLLWSLYGVLVIHDPFIWGPNAAGLLASTAQIALFAVYGLPPRSPHGGTTSVPYTQLRRSIV